MSLRAIVHYHDHISKVSAEAICSRLRTILPAHIAVQKVNSVFLHKNDWKEGTVLLAMGAGECRDLDRELGDQIKSEIRKYVNEGGKFLGFCKPAYWFASQSKFALVGEQPMIRERPFPLFDGTVEGPLEPLASWRSPESARAVPVCSGNEVGEVYMQGGPKFNFRDVEKNGAKTMLRLLEPYPDAAAMISKQHGKGKWILGTVHPEYQWTHFAMPIISDVSRTLATPANKQFADLVWQDIGHEFGYCRL